MGKLMNIVTPLHTRTARDYLGRMNDSKVECMKVARRYGADFWDGDRRFGYGGFQYDGRWKPVAQALITAYGLPRDARILDVGCGKGFLLHEFKELLPDGQVTGFDISQYALEHAKEEVKDRLFLHRAQDPYPFEANTFDLVLSIHTLHNLHLADLQATLQQMQRVGRNRYLAVESYRSEEELFNLQCWALTCAAFFTPQDWGWLFATAGYSGDYEFVYF
jgi:SAM-dependent methyltransferase